MDVEGGAVMPGMISTEYPHVKIAPSQAAGQKLKKPVLIGGKQFVPLVRQSLALACSLDILFLRREEPGSLILQGGDIDNRIKTLFDALKMPTADDMKIEEP